MRRQPLPLLRKVIGAFLIGGAASFVAAQTNAPQLPPLPSPRSPVEAFRTLLLLPRAERAAQLAKPTAEVREKILAKIREYELMSPEERELRLKATELRWYLRPLMTAPATNRPTQLALVPDSIRDLVAQRIALWDKFPPALQQMMLTNQAKANYLVTGVPTNYPPSPTAALHSRLQEQFDRLFDLTESEQKKVLATLSDAERRQMERTLAAYADLTAEQRRRCLVSFSQFRNMSPVDQQDFLKNASHWSQMSPAERQSWRELVSNASRLPPLPGLTRRPPPLPRLPTVATPSAGSNGG